jgi:hypothetical protein
MRPSARKQRIEKQRYIGFAPRRSAELHSAVSQICNLLRAGRKLTPRFVQHPAECNSAIQQIENLRYNCLGPRRSAELHSAVSQIWNQLCSAFPLLWGGLREEWAGAERFRVGAQICDLSVTQS